MAENTLVLNKIDSLPIEEKYKKAMKELFISEIQFGKTVYEQATNCFLNNESASLLGTIRLKLFLYFCSCGAYVLAALLL